MNLIKGSWINILIYLKDRKHMNHSPPSSILGIWFLNVEQLLDGRYMYQHQCQDDACHSKKRQSRLYSYPQHLSQHSTCTHLHYWTGDVRGMFVQQALLNQMVTGRMKKNFQGHLLYSLMYFSILSRMVVISAL